KPAWDHVTVRIITNNGSRLAALLSGDVDAIEGVPTTDIDNVKTNAKFVYAQKQSARLVYLYVDSGHADTPQVTAKDGGQLGGKRRRWRRRMAASWATIRPRWSGCAGRFRSPSTARRSARG